MKLDLWVRLNITMADDNKVSGWTQIYGKHELAMYKKPTRKENKNEDTKHWVWG